MRLQRGEVHAVAQHEHKCASLDDIASYYWCNNHILSGEIDGGQESVLFCLNRVPWDVFRDTSQSKRLPSRHYVDTCMIDR